MDRGATSVWSKKLPLFRVQEKQSSLYPILLTAESRAAILKVQAASHKSIQQGYLYRLAPAPAL